MFTSEDDDIYGALPMCQVLGEVVILVVIFNHLFIEEDPGA